MTRNGNFKRRVRSRAAKTGESYTTARMQVRKAETPPSRVLRLAVAQTPIRMDLRDTAQFRASGQEIRDLMHQAHILGADLVHFPEGATCWPDKRILSDTYPDTVGPADWSKFQWAALRTELEAIRQLAGQLGIWVVFGSVHPLTQPQRPHNSLYVVSHLGDVVTRYDERMLSNTKVSYMYTPGARPITFQVNGLRLGCALGMESHFPEIFIEYEQLDVDCVLFSTTGSTYPGDATFTAEVAGHAASNSFWVSYAVPAKQNATAISGIVTPRGAWAARCALDGTSSIAVFEIDGHAENHARPWRRTARSGIYDAHRVSDDPRSDKRDVF